MTPHSQQSKILDHGGGGLGLRGRCGPVREALWRLLGVFRVTAGRLCCERSEDGIWLRSAGVGTVRAVDVHALEIHNIADEPRSRGRVQRGRGVMLRTIHATGELTRKLGVFRKTQLVHSLPLQAENRGRLSVADCYVNRALVLDHDESDFSLMPPDEYLTQGAAHVSAVVRARRCVGCGTPDGAALFSRGAVGIVRAV